MTIQSLYPKYVKEIHNVLVYEYLIFNVGVDTICAVFSINLYDIFQNLLHKLRQLIIVCFINTCRSFCIQLRFYFVFYLLFFTKKALSLLSDIQTFFKRSLFKHRYEHSNGLFPSSKTLQRL